ncbi:MAG: SDR family NAD(P)-dependent oxidoreductase, partial [Pseudomonadales bacterium]
SVNGFWATIGPAMPHSAYSAAKFAVKGFSEALITDLRLHAPHVKVSVVMPGHIGTSIVLNSGKVLGRGDALNMPEAEVKQIRERMMKVGGPNAELLMNLSDDQLREVLHQRGVDFRDQAPTTAASAAGIIIDGVLSGKWRILVGDDAHNLDRRVRQDPENAYEPEFLQALQEGGDFGPEIIQSVQ